MNLKYSTEEPAWSADHAAALRQFLGGTTGQTLLARLHWSRPTPSTPHDVNVPFDPERRRAMADHLSGFESAIAEILQHTVSPN